MNTLHLFIFYTQKSLSRRVVFKLPRGRCVCACFVCVCVCVGVCFFFVVCVCMYVCLCNHHISSDTGRYTHTNAHEHIHEHLHEHIHEHKTQKKKKKGRKKEKKKKKHLSHTGNPWFWAGRGRLEHDAHALLEIGQLATHLLHAVKYRVRVQNNSIVVATIISIDLE